MEKNLTRKVLQKISKEDAIKELEIWLKNSPHAKLWLTNKLGYTVTNTIEMWMRRGSIPNNQVHRVLRFIRSEDVRQSN